jgi:hypothetical protein
MGARDLGIRVVSDAWSAEGERPKTGWMMMNASAAAQAFGSAAMKRGLAHSGTRSTCT